MNRPTLESRAYLLMLLEHDSTAECEATGCRDCALLREVLGLVDGRIEERRASVAA
ncbi:MAG TPA: hypothetical protein VN428_02300 [Bryobacteraceae bacterium]|nr:hypothetical protein [Bryobacteraceae bacterium]